MKTENHEGAQFVKIHSFLNKAQDIVIGIENGRIVYVNDRACDILGQSHGELLNKQMSDLLAPEDNERMGKFYAFERQTGILAEEIEHFILRKDGTRRFVSVHPFSSCNVGDALRWYVIWTDITGRKSEWDALKESEERYRVVVTQIPLAIGIFNQQGDREYLNPAFTDILGYTPEDIPNSRAWFLNAFPDPKARETAMTALFQDLSKMRDHAILPREFTVTCKDGSKRILLMQLVLLKNQSFLCFCQDITIQRRAQETAQQLFIDASKISEIKANLLTLASHEFKTPLVPLLGWLDWCRVELKHGKKIEDLIDDTRLESMYSGARRLELVINNLLNVDRISKIQIKLEKQEHSITSLLQAAIANVAPMAQVAEITISNESHDQNVQVDRIHIEQVFTNILSNAIRYSPPYTRIRILSEGQPDSYSILFVDQGYGFTPEELDMVWRPLAPPSSRKDTWSYLGGAGLGIYVAKYIIEQHGGILSIRSDGPDKGTTVIVTLPTK